MLPNTLAHAQRTYLDMLKEPSALVSPNGVFTIDPRVWLSNKWFSSSDTDLRIAQYSSQGMTSFQEVRDPDGKLLALTNVGLANVKPGQLVKLDILIRNGAGKGIETDLKVSVVKPFISFAKDVWAFEVQHEEGVFDLSSERFYERGIILSSTDTVILKSFNSDLPLHDCQKQFDSKSNWIGIRCDKDKLDIQTDYTVDLEITTPEGVSDKRSFDVMQVFQPALKNVPSHPLR